jgi:hypothetical protein
MKGLPFTGAFKEHMFNKMGHAMLMIRLIPGTGIDQEACMSHHIGHPSVDNPNSVRKLKCLVIHFTDLPAKIRNQMNILVIQGI